jgi:hypothetical protein
MAEIQHQIRTCQSCDGLLEQPRVRLYRVLRLPTPPSPEWSTIRRFQAASENHRFSRKKQVVHDRKRTSRRWM